MTKTTLTISFLVSVCVALALTASAQTKEIYAQRLVDQVAAKHPELNVIGLHVTPPNSSDNIIIASSIRNKVGKKSDPDDLEVMTTGKPFLKVLKPRELVDTGLPLYDAGGAVIGTVVMEVKFSFTQDPQVAMRRAIEVRDELKRQIQSKEQLFSDIVPAQSKDIYAQLLVDQIAAKHPELNLLSIHAIPPNSSDSMIIASTIKSKVGKKSDPDDIEVMTNNKPDVVAKKDRELFDTGLPLYDAGGAVIGTIVMEVKFSFTQDQQVALRQITQIRDELKKQITSKGQLFSEVDLDQASSAADSTQGPLKLLQVIPLPGVTGDFDHFAIDTKGNRLFLTAEEHHSIEVFEATTGKHLKSVGGFDTPHSALYLPESNTLYVIDGGDGTCKVVRGDTYAIVKTIKLAKEADSMAYDAVRKRIYVANGGKEAEMDYSLISVISTANNTHLNDIKIDSGNIEAMAIAYKRPQLYVNLRDKGQLGIVDLTKNSLVASWPLPVSGNTPIQLDENDRRIYLVGRKPGKFVVLDSETGKVIATLACVEGADEMNYDAKHSRFYITGAEGFITVIEKRNANEYETVAKIPTGYRGKNSIYVPELGRFYVAVSEHEGKPAELRVYQVD